MPIDNNGVITPNKNYKNYKKPKLAIIISIITVSVSVLGLFLQHLNYSLELKKYENEINQLEIQMKENQTQVKVSYFECSVNAMNILQKICKKTDWLWFFTFYSHNNIKSNDTFLPIDKCTL